MGDRRPNLTPRSTDDVIAAGVFVAVLVWGLLLCLEVAYAVMGVTGVVLGAVLLPVLLMSAPWYALFALGNPLPMVLCYGGATLGWALIAFPGAELRRRLRG